MYYDYFGLNQPPFRITPDTSLFFPGGDRGAVLDALIYAIINGEGMVKVVGEVGSGKTMLCRMLEQELPDRVEVVYLANPSLSPENILHAIAFELKLTLNPDTSRLEVMHNLQEYLLKRHAENRQVVVFVEEAQAMPIATLEEIRLLSNLETQQSKLLQIVLFGQPELDELIANPEIRQLKERITYSFQLNPFASEHIRDYINSRLRASGYRAGEVFDKGAIRQIERYSKGLLRRVNILADKAMLAAFASNTNQVSAGHVKQAARDSEFINQKKYWLWGGLASACLLLVCVLLIALWQGRESTAEQGRVQHKIDAETVEKTAREEPRPEPKEAESVSANTPVKASIEAPVKENPAKVREAEGPAKEEIAAAYAAPPAAAKVAAKKGADEPAVQEPPIAAKSAKIAVEQEIAPVKPEKRQGLQESSETRLLGLSSLFELQDLGDARLTSEESAKLRKQLKELPPEVALYQDSAQFSDICKLCWSILYRPLTDPENL